MKKKTVLILFFLVFTQFFLVNQVKADDLILTGSISGDYYSMENILTQGSCEVEQGSSASLVTIQTIALNPGFHVSLGGSLSIDNSDTDSDWLPDAWEIAQFGSITVYNDINSDPDNDGITLYWECNLGLSGTIPEFDIDSDGMPDWYEVAAYQSLENDEQSGDCDCD